jgi:hypothetical protein
MTGSCCRDDGEKNVELRYAFGFRVYQVWFINMDDRKMFGSISDVVVP